MQKARKSRRGAFTLIELLVVMAILAMLAALVAPNLFAKLESSEIKTARLQMKNLETALLAFRLDVTRLPTEAEGLKVLWKNPGNLENWGGPYMDKEVKGDPWGHPYIYKCPGPGDHKFDLISLGADGAQGGEGVNADLSIWDN